MQRPNPPCRPAPACVACSGRCRTIAVLLLATLVRADELLRGGCRDCGATLIVDRWSLRAPRCPLCAADHAQAGLEVASVGAG